MVKFSSIRSGAEAVCNSIKKVAYGSATPNNSGISRVINGTQYCAGGGRIVYKGGVKHLVSEFLYRDCLTKYMEALNKGNIEEAEQILKKVPAVLNDTFLEYGELNHLFTQGNSAKVGDKLSSIRQKIMKIFSRKQSINDGGKVIITETVLPSKQNLGKSVLVVSDKVSVEAQLDKIVKEKPMARFLIDILRQDHVEDKEILKILNTRLYRQKTGDRFYRFIGREELDKVLSGEMVTSNRPCHKGCITDVTTNPNYEKISTAGKYRILFKDKPEFNPYGSEVKRVASKDIAEKEFHLLGGYSLDDIEKIEQKVGDNDYRTIWTSRLETTM